MSDEIRIDKSARWTARGSMPFEEPGPWIRGASGQWKRSGLVPYGRADVEYRARWFTCAECGSPLLPTNLAYRFGCTGCGLVFGTGFSGLWGYPPNHAKAMFLTDAMVNQSEF